MTVDPDAGTEDLLERSCEICGTQLSQAEIEDARDNGSPFLCSVHAAEALPAVEDPEIAGGAEPAA